MSFQNLNCNCPLPTPVGRTLADNCGGSAVWLFMAILEGYLRAQCDIAEPCGRVTPRIISQPDPSYDFIVIGGGTAGSVVASRLSENKDWRVLLVEAGEDEPLGAQVPSMLTFFGSPIDWQYKTEKEKVACLNNGGVCNWPRGKVLGGTSVMNGMMYIRGNREDYNKWADLGNKGWSYDEVLPLFMKSENNLQYDNVDKRYHAKGGLLQISHFPYHPPMADEILKGARELGYNPADLNGSNSTGFMIAQTLSKNGIRHSSARAFLRPIRDRENLHILVNTLASKVLIDPQTKKVKGVEVLNIKTKKVSTIRVTKEVVVSGGAVNSPQILLLSGVGPQEDLQKVGVELVHHLPGVGKNLMNHVSYQVNYFLNESNENPLNWATALQYLVKRDGLLSGTGLSQVTGKIASPYAEPKNVPDTQFYFGGYLATCSKNGTDNGDEPEGPRRVSISPTVLHPKSKGYLTLASKDPSAPPRIVPNYLTQKHDVKVLINGIRFANKLAETAPLKKLGMKLDRTPVKGCEKARFDSDEYWECAIRRDTAPENHQAGSCKMGPKSDVNAVVDSQLRVHGITGLRVMDTSIMPELTSGNTMAPAIMIAEKGVSMIKDFWKCVEQHNQGYHPYGQQPYGQQPYGQHNHAHYPYGEHNHGYHPYGQHNHAHNPYGQHNHGQQPYGQHFGQNYYPHQPYGHHHGFGRGY